jgi:hypothetical protein
MKPHLLHSGKLLVCLSLFLLAGFTVLREPSAESKFFQGNQTNIPAGELAGAWQLKGASANGQPVTVTQAMADGFFSVAHFDQAGKKFLGTYGGTYTLANNKWVAKYEFNTFDSTRVGTSVTGTISRVNNRFQLLVASGAGKAQETWEKVREKTAASPLMGAWRISGREGQNGQMNTMTPGPRKTIKILSGDRFQWIAFNSATAAFSGTGGGTYTAQNGKYTEHIEFFSRDSSRVGMQLSFNYAVKDGNWHHSGLSSTGNKINEIWQRVSKQ